MSSYFIVSRQELLAPLVSRKIHRERVAYRPFTTWDLTISFPVPLRTPIVATAVVVFGPFILWVYFGCGAVFWF